MFWVKQIKRCCLYHSRIKAVTMYPPASFIITGFNIIIDIMICNYMIWRHGGPILDYWKRKISLCGMDMGKYKLCFKTRRAAEPFEAIVTTVKNLTILFVIVFFNSSLHADINGY